MPCARSAVRNASRTRRRRRFWGRRRLCWAHDKHGFLASGRIGATEDAAMDPRPNTQGFSDVDRSVDPAYFTRYLDAAGALPFLQAVERRIVERLGPRAGGRFLDV